MVVFPARELPPSLFLFSIKRSIDSFHAEMVTCFESVSWTSLYLLYASFEINKYENQLDLNFYVGKEALEIAISSPQSAGSYG